MIQQETLHRIKELFSEFNIENHPGSQMGIIYKNELIFEYAYGMADLERNAKITMDSIFDIASISKQFVAVGILLLQEDGLLNIDNEIQTYIPDFPVLSQSISLRHLLNHTSGIQDYMDLMETAKMSESNIYNKDDLFNLVSASKPVHEPGAQFSYSNSNYFLLALIMEKVTNESFPEYMSKRIFKPLGMNNTMFCDDHKKIVPNRVLSYTTAPNKEHQNFPYIFNIVGDTGLLTNVHDLVKWDSCFYNDSDDFISSSIKKQLQTKNRLNDNTETDYGYGLFIDDFNGLTAIGHDGAAAGYRSEMVRIQEKKLTIISLSNFSGMKRVVHQIGEMVLKEL